jgi:LysM repeat protein
MKANKQSRVHSQKRHLFRYPAFILIIFTLLSGCNFPQATQTLPTLSHQQRTEISGILNPSGLETGEPTPTETLSTPVPTAAMTSEEPRLDGYIYYLTQQGDTLSALAKRFNVPEEDIFSPIPLNSEGLLPVGMPVQIPDRLEAHLPYVSPIFPDSEVIYGPSVGDFETITFIESAGGFLASYAEEVKEQTLSGPEIVHWVALETSTNPRLLLAFLEYQSGWVFGFPPGAEDDPYPIGFGATLDTGLYKELMITARILAQGFYGWRDGSRIWLSFYGGETARLAPELNPGSTALMALFASIYPREVWEDHLFGEDSFLNFYREMFGDYASRAAEVEPYLSDTTQQPELALPFAPGEEWSFTGGPHITWQTGTPRGAVDFAPISGEGPCMTSAWWATAAAPGLIVRSERNVVAIDLDGDGDEGTGWVLIYMHIAEEDRPFVGLQVDRDDPIGHPSCEGGNSTGTHVHFARKFNGEWIGVGDPLPMVLSGWQVFAGERRYEGYMQKGEQIVTAVPYGSSDAKIIRDE